MAAKRTEQLSELWWYALRVPPQKEFVAQTILARYGVETYVPVRKEWRRRNKYTKTKELRSYPEAPRYVFAGFRPGFRLWFDLFNLPAINGVVGTETAQKPMRVPFEGKRGLGTMMKTYPNGIVAPNEQRFMQTHKEYAVGDMVEIFDGPFSGLTVPVVDIRGANAVIKAMLFGSEHEVTIPLENLIAAE